MCVNNGFFQAPLDAVRACTSTSAEIKHQPTITGYEVVSEIGRTKNDNGVEGVTIGFIT